MKKSKAKTKRVKPSPRKKSPTRFEKRPPSFLPLSKLHVQATEGKPIQEPAESSSLTTERLAGIAATLARTTHADPDRLVNHAFKIWSATQGKLEDERNRQDERDNGVQLQSGKFFGSDLFLVNPMSRELFFKRVLPLDKRHRKDEVKKIGKAFLRYLFIEDVKREPSPDEISSLYEEFNAGDLLEADNLALVFATWYRQRVSESHRAAGKKSGKKNSYIAGQKKLKKIDFTY
jgi:hypothetical protein